MSFPGSNHLYLLYPSYHIPNNPQDTLSLSALKYYSEARSVRIEALSWLRVVSNAGDSVQVPTIPVYQKTELQDYVSINIHTLPEKITTLINPEIHHPKIARTTLPPIPSFLSDEDQYSTNFRVSLHAPKVNVSFSKHDYTDWSILHRRFDHLRDEKLAEMCKLQLLDGLPSKFPTSHRCHRRDCWICPRGSLHNDPHGITINTDHLRPGILIHMDFFFMNTISIRGFTSILNIVDAKTRKLWLFNTPSKTPPLDIVRFFLKQLFRMGRPVSHIRTDLGGELAGSAEFCAMLKDEFQIALERTGTYSSWMNGKVERHNQTVTEMIRVGNIDHGLGDELWCCKAEDAAQKYMLYFILHIKMSQILCGMAEDQEYMNLEYLDAK